MHDINKLMELYNDDGYDDDDPTMHDVCMYCLY